MGPQEIRSLAPDSKINYHLWIPDSTELNTWSSQLAEEGTETPTSDMLVIIGKEPGGTQGRGWLVEAGGIELEAAAQTGGVHGGSQMSRLRARVEAEKGAQQDREPGRRK